MATNAKITNVDAIEAFRASIIIFLNKAHSALDQELDEIRRTRSWIQNDQRTKWEQEVRKRQRVLAQAEQEMLSARMTKAADNLTLQQMAVRKAKTAVEEAADKLRKVKIWMRDFDSTVEPLAKGLSSLRTTLDHDMPKAIAYLVEIRNLMEEYLEVQKSSPLTAPIAATDTPAENPTEAHE
jgi:chromosome segregation ATPase